MAQQKSFAVIQAINIQLNEYIICDRLRQFYIVY